MICLLLEDLQWTGDINKKKKKKKGAWGQAGKTTFWLYVLTKLSTNHAKWILATGMYRTKCSQITHINKIMGNGWFEIEIKKYWKYIL